MASGIFLQVKQADLEHDLEAYEIAKQVAKISLVTNNFYPESAFMRVVGLEVEYPKVISGKTFGAKVLPTEGYSSLEEFIERNEYLGIDSLVIDDKSDRPEFLIDVFKNENNYPYLIKKYDSKDHGFSYHVKFFQIDFSKFKSNINADQAS